MEERSMQIIAQGNVSATVMEEHKKSWGNINTGASNSLIG